VFVAVVPGVKRAEQAASMDRVSLAIMKMAIKREWKVPIGGLGKKGGY